MRFLRGLPEIADGVLFYADDSCCSSVLDEWCPNVNFFENSDEARRWAVENGVAGTVVGLREAAERGAREWAPLVGASREAIVEEAEEDPPGATG